jgi:hypothetical protein
VSPEHAIIEGIEAVDRRAVPDDEAGEASVMQAKSEETRAAELGSASTWMLGLGAACVLGAAISLGSALWLTTERLSEVAPPQDLLQGDRFW